MNHFKDAPAAAAVAVLRCEAPECNRPHIMLYDTECRPIAQFVVPELDSDGNGFIKDLMTALRKSAIDRGAQ